MARSRPDKRFEQELRVPITLVSELTIKAMKKRRRKKKKSRRRKKKMARRRLIFIKTDRRRTRLSVISNELVKLE